MNVGNYGSKKKALYENKLENYMPLHNGILLETVTVEEKTDGGIYLPTEMIEQQKNTIDDSKAWKVAKVGPETTNIKVGDWVIMGGQTPFAVELSEGLYLQVFENWIVGIFREGITAEDVTSSKAIVSVPDERPSL